VNNVGANKFVRFPHCISLFT